MNCISFSKKNEKSIYLSYSLSTVWSSTLGNLCRPRRLRLPHFPSPATLLPLSHIIASDYSGLWVSFLFLDFIFVFFNEEMFNIPVHKKFRWVCIFKCSPLVYQMHCLFFWVVFFLTRLLKISNPLTDRNKLFGFWWFCFIYICVWLFFKIKPVSCVHQFELVSVCGLVCILLFILLPSLIIVPHLILQAGRM